MGPFGDLAQNVLIGGWMVVAPLALYIVRKPGVGIGAEIIAAVIEVVFLASPVGPMLLLVGLVQGAGAELPFFVTRYRRYGWAVFVLSGISAAIFNLVLGMVRFGWLGQDFFALRVLFQVLSGIVLCGVLAKVIGNALLRTGVLDNYAIGRAGRTRWPAWTRGRPRYRCWRNGSPPSPRTPPTNCACPPSSTKSPSPARTEQCRRPRSRPGSNGPWSRSAVRTCSTGAPASSPVARGSASHWPPSSPPTRSCCCWTSRPPCSTRPGWTRSGARSPPPVPPAGSAPMC